MGQWKTKLIYPPNGFWKGDRHGEILTYLSKNSVIQIYVGIKTHTIQPCDSENKFKCTKSWKSLSNPTVVIETQECHRSRQVFGNSDWHFERNLADRECQWFPKGHFMLNKAARKAFDTPYVAWFCERLSNLSFSKAPRHVQWLQSQPPDQIVTLFFYEIVRETPVLSYGGGLTISDCLKKKSGGFLKKVSTKFVGKLITHNARQWAFKWTQPEVLTHPN